MPIISLTISRPADPALSALIAAEITALTRIHLKKDPALTAIAITSIDPQHWFAGGRSLADQGLNSFWLDIKVVDATNTKAEMSDYIGQVFVTMTRLLGRVHHESYTLVHEVPAAAYGFGGRTQEYRYIAGRLDQAA